MKVVGCFLEYDKKFVIVLRHAHKPEGNTWGIPGGKVEQGEQEQAAIIRELGEETGYQTSPDELEQLGAYDFISGDGKPFVYIPYRVRLKRPHRVQLETAAHAAYQWVTADECDARPDLIFGLHDLLRWTGYVPKDK